MQIMPTVFSDPCLIFRHQEKWSGTKSESLNEKDIKYKIHESKNIIKKIHKYYNSIGL